MYLKHMITFAVLFFFISVMFLVSTTVSAKNKGMIDVGGDVIIGNSAGNIMNNGFIAQQGEWLYYADYFYANKHGLYKIKTDLTGRKKLSNDKPEFINVVGDWIYYNSRGKIYKMTTEGKYRRKISNDNGAYITYYNGWIYYVDRDKRTLYKMDTNGKNKSLVVKDEVLNFSICDRFIYYTSPTSWVNDVYPVSAIYRITLDGAQKNKIIDERANYPITINEDWLLYKADGKLAIARTNGSKNIILKEGISALFCNFIKNYKGKTTIVFSPWLLTGLEEGINLIDLDSNGKIVSDAFLVRAYNIQGICVIDDWIYFACGKRVGNYNSKFIANEIYRVKRDGSIIEWISRKE